MNPDAALTIVKAIKRPYKRREIVTEADQREAMERWGRYVTNLQVSTPEAISCKSWGDKVAPPCGLCDQDICECEMERRVIQRFAPRYNFDGDHRSHIDLYYDIKYDEAHHFDPQLRRITKETILSPTKRRYEDEIVSVTKKPKFTKREREQIQLQAMIELGLLSAEDLK